MDFKDTINARLSEGQSIEDIMAEFAAAANEIEQEAKYTEAERDKVIEELEDSFWGNINDIYIDDLSFNDATNLITLILAYEHQDLSADDIRGLSKYVNLVLNNIYNDFKIVNSAKEGFKKLFTSSVNKSKKNCGTDRQCCSCEKNETGDSDPLSELAADVVGSFMDLVKDAFPDPLTESNENSIKEFLKDLLD